MAELNLDQIRQTMPWRYMTLPTGQVIVYDKNNVEVPMFTMLDFTVHLSTKMAK